MKVVIQCAGDKDRSAGSLQTADRRRVYFVAHPPECRWDGQRLFAHPDDPSEDGRTWRERLLAYNAAPGTNSLGLLPAYQLYKRDVYQLLAVKFGIAKLFILSAGWGLIPASFLTPDYNITFSGSAASAFRRRRTDVFRDWSMIEPDDAEPLIFLGGQDYLPHFVRLTARYRGPRIALFNSRQEPRHDGLVSIPYPTTTRTNWHYGAAMALLDGTLRLPGVSTGSAGCD